MISYREGTIAGPNDQFVLDRSKHDSDINFSGGRSRILGKQSRKTKRLNRYLSPMIKALKFAVLLLVAGGLFSGFHGSSPPATAGGSDRHPVAIPTRGDTDAGPP